MKNTNYRIVGSVMLMDSKTLNKVIKKAASKSALECEAVAIVLTTLFTYHSYKIYKRCNKLESRVIELEKEQAEKEINKGE